MDAVAAYQQKSNVNEHALIETHAPMVKRIAHHLKGKLPNNVMLEDLIQAGMIGLLEAAKKYCIKHKCSGITYQYNRYEVRNGNYINYYKIEPKLLSWILL